MRSLRASALAMLLLGTSASLPAQAAPVPAIERVIRVALNSPGAISLPFIACSVRQEIGPEGIRRIVGAGFQLAGAVDRSVRECALPAAAEGLRSYRFLNKVSLTRRSAVLEVVARHGQDSWREEMHIRDDGLAASVEMRTQSGFERVPEAAAAGDGLASRRIRLLPDPAAALVYTVEGRLLIFQETPNLVICQRAWQVAPSDTAQVLRRLRSSSRSLRFDPQCVSRDSVLPLWNRPVPVLLIDELLVTDDSVIVRAIASRNQSGWNETTAYRRGRFLTSKGTLISGAAIP